MRSCSPASTSSDHAATRYRSTRTSLPSTAGRCRRSRSCRVRRCAIRHRRWWSRWSSASPPWPVSPVLCRRRTCAHGVSPSCTRSPSAWMGGRCTSRCVAGVVAARRGWTAWGPAAPTPARHGSPPPPWFPPGGLVHLDLHTDNILAGDDGTLTGIIDWEGACAGDPRFDLVRFAYDLDGHDQPAWDVVEATGIERRVLRAYVAHHALRCTSWQIHHHTDDVPRQLDRAERVLERD